MIETENKMKERSIFKTAKSISVLLAILVLLCSFANLNLKCESHTNHDFATGIVLLTSDPIHLDKSTSFDKIISVHSQILYKQSNVRRNAVSTYITYHICNLVIFALLLAFYSFAHLHNQACSHSNYYVINYIHNKDGKKS